MSARSLVSHSNAQPLKGRTIVLPGDFGQDRPHERLKHWIRVNGGEVVTSISDRVTHVVCSKHNWKKQPANITDARKHKGIKIVNLDWLEESLQECRRLREGRYLWINIDKEEKRAKAKQKALTREGLKKTEKQFLRGCDLAQQDLLSDSYHLYRDDTGYQYEAPLWKDDHSINFIYCNWVRIYETNQGPPFFYATVTTYKLPRQKPVTHILTPMGSQFHEAFKTFRSAFKSFTGVNWDYRMHGHQTRPEYHKDSEKLELVGIKEQSEGGGASKKPVIEEGRQMFKYTLPRNGEPLGELGMEEEGLRRYGEPPAGLKTVGGTPPPLLGADEVKE